MRLWCLVAVAVLAAGCGAHERKASTASAPKPVPQLASGKPLPAGCTAGKVRRRATVTFVASGRAWALEPKSGRLTCLFPVENAGPFEWGPRADRVLLARLEVKGFARAPTRPAGSVDPTAASWGRPIGKSIVFVGKGGSALLKAHPGGGGFLDVTPVRGAQYKGVAYHPSGLAFAFILRRNGRESIWLSSNLGKKPEQLVHGRFHTGFDTLAFGDGGTTLYFAARHKDDHVDVHNLPLVGATQAPVAWQGKPGEHVTDLLPGWADLALTVGRACSARRVVVVTSSHPKGVDALPRARTSRALGWIADRRLLVAAGGCGGPLDLYSVETGSLAATLLVKNVDAASVRRAEPLPPPPLPQEANGARSSFA